MNCDQAFDYLTNRDLRDCDELTRHLSKCPRCRQMRETLEPAFDLIEGVFDEPSLDAPLPQYDLEDSKAPVLLSMESIRVAEAAAAELKTMSESHASRSIGSRRMLQFAVTFVAGTAAALLFVAMSGNRNDTTATSQPFALSELTNCSMLFPSLKFNTKLTPQTAILTCVTCHSGNSHDHLPPTDSDTNALAMSTLRTCLACHIVDLKGDLPAEIPSVKKRPSNSGSTDCGWLAARG